MPDDSANNQKQFPHMWVPHMWDFDYDGCVSPYYWENNNPAALLKSHYGDLKTVGSENEETHTVVHNRTDFESYVLNSNSEIEPFRNFIEQGQKFGTVNVAECECSCFDLLKRMYGSFVYLVLEDRAFNKDDPRLKHKRRVMLFDEYQLCKINDREYISDMAFQKYKESPYLPNTSNSSNHNTTYLNSFIKTNLKMFHNGFTTSDNSRSPTKEEYYSNVKRDRLDSTDLMNLLWKFVCNSHRNDAGSEPNSLAWYLYHCNIVGCGWLPCLFAKKNPNELDKIIICCIKSGNTIDNVSVAEHSKPNVNDKLYGSTKVLVLSNVSGDLGSKNATKAVASIPLRKIENIEREQDANGIFIFTVIDTDGNSWKGNCYEIVENYATISMKGGPFGEYEITKEYLSGDKSIYYADSSLIKQANIPVYVLDNNTVNLTELNDVLIQQLPTVANVYSSYGMNGT